MPSLFGRQWIHNCYCGWCAVFSPIGNLINRLHRTEFFFLHVRKMGVTVGPPFYKSLDFYAKGGVIEILGREGRGVGGENIEWLPNSC